MGNELATAKTNLRAVMRQEDVISRFSDVLGSVYQANGYISSVLIAVAQNEKLRECNANSIISSSLRAATMRLSVDPSAGHAHLVPYKGVCTLIIGWRGIYHMAIRTGKYRYINLFPIFKTDKLTYNPFSGFYGLEREGNQFDIEHTTGGDGDISGYMLSFEMITSFKKMFYMTCEECDAHGAKYAPAYFDRDGKKNKLSMWHKDPHVMFRKTVIRQGLTKWGYLDPSDLQLLSVSEEDPVEGQFSEGGVSVDFENDPESTPEEREEAAEKSMAVLGFEEPKKKAAKPAKTETAPEPITPTQYWNKVNETIGHDEGKKLLEKLGGDLDDAYRQLTKL